jgi:hypothetical protein
MRSKHDDPNKRQSKRMMLPRNQPGLVLISLRSARPRTKWLKAASSTDGSVLNDEDMNGKSGDSFAVSAVVANVSSFALKDISMSHFDIQTNEDSSSRAQRFMEHKSEACISGDESKINEIGCAGQDAKASLSFCPVGLALAKKTHDAASDQPLKTSFDPGSDKTFVDQRVLPKGENGNAIDPSPVSMLSMALMSSIKKQSSKDSLHLHFCHAENGQKSSGLCFRSAQQSLRSCPPT